MSLDPVEADAIVKMLDFAWQDVPLRPETIAIWVNELVTSDRILFDMNDAAEAVQFLLHTEPRRPALNVVIDEGRSQFKARKDAEHEAERNARLAGELNP